MKIRSCLKLKLISHLNLLAFFLSSSPCLIFLICRLGTQSWLNLDTFFLSFSSLGPNFAKCNGITELVVDNRPRNNLPFDMFWWRLLHKRDEVKVTDWLEYFVLLFKLLFEVVWTWEGDAYEPLCLSEASSVDSFSTICTRKRSQFLLSLYPSHRSFMSSLTLTFSHINTHKQKTPKNPQCSDLNAQTKHISEGSVRLVRFDSLSVISIVPLYKSIHLWPFEALVEFCFCLKVSERSAKHRLQTLVVKKAFEAHESAGVFKYG